MNCWEWLWPLVAKFGWLYQWYTLSASGYINWLIPMPQVVPWTILRVSAHCSIFPYFTLHHGYVISPQSSMEIIKWCSYYFFIIIPSMSPMWGDLGHSSVSRSHQIKVGSHSSSPILLLLLFLSFPWRFLISLLLSLSYIPYFIHSYCFLCHYLFSLKFLSIKTLYIDNLPTRRSPPLPHFKFKVPLSPTKSLCCILTSCVSILSHVYYILALILCHNYVTFVHVASSELHG